MTQTAKKSTGGMVLEKDNPPAVDLVVTDAALAKLREQYSDLPVNLEDKDTYRKNQDAINDLRSYRPKVKDKAKQLKDDANAWVKKVTAEQNRIDGEIVEILQPIVDRKKEYDDQVAAEKERKRKADQIRKDAHLANINGIRILISKAQNQPSAEIEQVISELEGIVIDDSFEEFEKDALDAHEDTYLALQRMLISAQTREEEDYRREEENKRIQAETERLNKERAENERIRKENERIAEENRKAAEALKAPVEPVIENTYELGEGEACIQEDTTPKAGISHKVQTKVDDDNSVIAQAEQNTLKAIAQTIFNMPDMTEIEMSEGMLAAIRAGKIPNVKYDIY